VAEVGQDLEAAQRDLLASATAFRDERTIPVTSVDEAVEAAQSGFAVLPWAAVGLEGEARLATAAVTVRCLQRPDGGLALSEDEPDLVAVCAKAY
jgi:prolyl-tRNA synthetase